MPKIDLRRRSAPSVGQLRDVVWVCTTVERPDDFVSTIVERPGVIRVHARIRFMRPETIWNYQAVFGDQDTPTREITIRCPPDVKIDLNHWVYQEGNGACSPPTWYKVRSVEDLGGVGRFLILRCSVDTVKDARTDVVTQQPPPVWETPAMD